MKPRLLDLFCGVGGASVGYARAGFEVVGVDIDPQPHYPFEFIQADALAADILLADGRHWDAIHASPPCQAYSVTRYTSSVQHPELVEPVRELLRATQLPYVIENVVGAPLIDPITLCGSMFNLQTADDRDGQPLYLRRHRLFESNVPLHAPRCLCRYFKAAGIKCGGVYGGGSTDRNHAEQVGRGGYTPNGPTRRRLMGIEWGTLKALNQAIPPAYTEYIGRQLMEML